MHQRMIWDDFVLSSGPWRHVPAVIKPAGVQNPCIKIKIRTVVHSCELYFHPAQLRPIFLSLSHHPAPHVQNGHQQGWHFPTLKFQAFQCLYLWSCHSLLKSCDQLHLMLLAHGPYGGCRAISSIGSADDWKAETELGHFASQTRGQRVIRSQRAAGLSNEDA